jgi:sugar phosphate isomerase/epimerase
MGGNAVDRQLTRRSFVTAALAVAGGAGLTARRQAGKYRIGVETYCFHDVDLAATLAHTKALGLRYLELHDGHLPHDSAPDALTRARAALDAAGIAPEGVYIHDAFTADETIARPIFKYAKRMGFAYINGGPKHEALPVLDRLAPEYGIRIAIHNHGPGSRYETLEHVTSVLDRYPHLSACVDIGHFARSKVDPVRAIRAVGRKAVAVHVKDVDAAGGNLVVGEGTIDMPGVFAALAETGFSGLLVLEYEGDFDNMDRRLAGMRKSLAMMDRLIAGSTSR